MQITGGSTAGYHPNAGIESSHSSLVGRMRWNEVWTMLFSPKAFQVGMGRDGGVSFGVHANEVGNDEAVGKTNKSADISRWRVQFGC